MLMALQDKLKGVVLWGIIILISIPFMLWGIQEYVGGGAVVNALVVNEREVPMREFDRSLAQLRQQVSQQFNGEIPDQFNDQLLRQQTADNLITLTLLEQVVEENQLYAGSITALPQFWLCTRKNSKCFH